LKDKIGAYIDMIADMYSDYAEALSWIIHNAMQNYSQLNLRIKIILQKVPTIKNGDVLNIFFPNNQSFYFGRMVGQFC
jgi:hypothetical protein